MGSEKWTDKRFGQRVKARREEAKWSQAYMAKMLSANGIQPMHPTTIAKIEAGDRSVRINEAVGIADLFEVSLDALLGRKEPDDTTLTFALATLTNYVIDAKRQVVQAQNVAGDIEDQLEDAVERFDSPHIELLQRSARDMAEHLYEARKQAERMDAITTLAFAEACEETNG